jgi:hypothetical protein
MMVTVLLTLAAPSCGSDPSTTTAGSTNQPIDTRDIEGQKVTVSTMAAPGIAATVWVEVEGYLDRGDQREEFLQEVWSEFADRLGSDLAKTEPDPWKLPRSDHDVCTSLAAGEKYGFWISETQARTPVINATRCPNS